MPRTETFNCPSCSAPLDAEGDAPTMRCPFCNNTLIVPEQLRTAKDAPDPAAAAGVNMDLGALLGQAAHLKEIARLVRSGDKIQGIKLYRETFAVGLAEAKDAVERVAEGKPVEVMHTTTVMSGPPVVSVSSASPPSYFEPGPPVAPVIPLPKARQSSAGVGCLVVAILGVVLLAILVPIGLAVLPSLGAAVSGAVSSNPLQPTATPGFANMVLQFGGEGTGVGLFTDARSVAVDGAGRIYVGEREGGRIQVFDSSGKFVSAWNWSEDRKALLRGMDADRQGTVYVVGGGRLARHEGATGKQLGRVTYGDRDRFDDVAVRPDGGLVAAWYANEDDIVRFDPQGQVVGFIQNAISGQSGDSELNTRLAVDGLGNIYALGTFNGAVFQFAPDGKFVNRFGADGDQPGQFRAPYAIAVDGQGRVYVSDVKGIQVFSPDGRYLDQFDVDGVAFGMAFDDQNALWVVTNPEKVFKFVLNAQ